MELRGGLNNSHKRYRGCSLQVSVIGLGKLGMPLAVVLAAAGNRVFAFDANVNLRQQIRSRSFQSHEPNLMDLLEKNYSNLYVVESIGEAILKSELSFIIVPTPSMPDGNFGNEAVIEVLAEIADALRIKDEFHVVDVVSTVMPGSCNEKFIPLLESRSGKTINVEFGLCYNPEFIALGSVMLNMQNPDMHLIGASGEKSGEILERALKSVTGPVIPSRIMNLKEAELVKISVNNFVTTKISFANMLMQIADKLGGIDVDVVTDAIGLDSRIGNKYLRGGASFGGPCFPRDTRAMATLMSQIDLNPAIPEATSVINRIQNEFLVEKVINQTATEGIVGLIGFSYKPDTNVYEESTGLNLAKMLGNQGKHVMIWEPLIRLSGLEVGDGLNFVTDLGDLSECSTLILTREFDQFELASFIPYFGARLVLDPWRQLSPIQIESLQFVEKYVPVGRSL